MVSRSLIPTLVGALFLVTGCKNSGPVSPSTDTPTLAQAQAPATGNDNKFVFTFDEDLSSVDCGAGEILDLHLEGWVQGRSLEQPSNPNLGVDIFHASITFTNTAGETFVTRDVEASRVYLDNGNILVALSGRFVTLPPGGLIGHLVYNAETFEVAFVAGTDIGDIFALACDALT